MKDTTRPFPPSLRAACIMLAVSLAVLVPMVRSLDEVAQVRAALAKAAAEAGVDPPELGIMVEVAATAAAAAALKSICGSVLRIAAARPPARAD